MKLTRYARTKDQLQGQLEALINTTQACWNPEVEPVLEITIEAVPEPRSLDQNALYWEWMTRLSIHFSGKGQGKFSKDDMHSLMRHRFLGYETKTIGNTEVTELRSTRKLPMAEMSVYMDQIDQWAADHGVLLPTPADAAHERYLASQDRRAKHAKGNR